jgi:cupin fold WbuC family metalloprotein
MQKIDNKLLNEVSARAKQSPRRRMNYNFHKDYSDTLQRLLNAIEPGSYLRPHKHENPDKREVFTVLRGKVLVVEFDPEGNIVDHMILEPSAGSFGAEIPEKTFHCILALEPGTVVYEIKDGPYSPIDDKNFATWAPREGEDGCVDYMDGILRRVGLL